MNKSNLLMTLGLSMSLITSLSSCGGRQSGAPLDEATFFVNEVSIDDVQAVAQKNGVVEVRRFQFKACLEDAVARSPIFFTDFEISDSFSKKRIKTDNNGCLLWQEVHRNVGINQRLLTIQRDFIGVEGYEGTVSVRFAFNPSEDNAFYDLRFKTPPQVDQKLSRFTFNSDLQTLSNLGINTDAGATFISDAALDFIGHDRNAAEINGLLTLKPRQRFQLRFSPKFLKRSLLGDIDEMSLKGGRFRVSLLVLRNLPGSIPQAGDLIAEYQGEVNVLHTGAVDSDILLRIHDLAGILSRNSVLMTVEPLGDLSLIASGGVFSGFISPLKGNSVGLNLRPISQNLQDITAAADTLLTGANQVPKAIDQLRKTPGLKEASPALAQAMLNKGSPGVTLNSFERSLICNALYPQQTQMVEVKRRGFFRKDETAQVAVYPQQRCKMMRPYVPGHPNDLSVETFELVEEVIPGSQKFVVGSDEPQTISLSSSFEDISRTNRSERTTGVQADVGGMRTLDVSGFLGFIPVIGPAIGKLLPISVGGGWGYGYVNSVKRSSGVTHSASRSVSQSISVYPAQYDVRLKTKKCWILKDTIAAEHRNYFACESKIRRRDFRETYYLVNHSIASSPFSDEEAQDNSKWRFLIRGRETFESVRKTLMDNNVVFQFTPKSLFKIDKESALLPDLNKIEAYPGAIPSQD